VQGGEWDLKRNFLVNKKEGAQMEKALEPIL